MGFLQYYWEIMEGPVQPPVLEDVVLTGESLDPSFVIGQQDVKQSFRPRVPHQTQTVLRHVTYVPYPCQFLGWF